jgi:ribosomal protein S18 acetylase RimI-like enzyme
VKAARLEAFSMAAVSGHSIAPASDHDQARVIATLVSAFIEDPVERWLFADPLQYLTHFPAFVAAFGGAAFGHGTAWMLADFSAVALWIPPGAQLAAEPIIAVLSNGVPPEQHADTFAVLDQMDAAHPTTPHWYLPWLGVDPARRGTGLGGELLEQCLAIVDADQLPVYLETPNPRTIPFYERHGFDVTNIATAGECPPITSMLRASQ